MKVVLYQLDGKIPNIALMRLAMHHGSLGHQVELKRAGNRTAIERGLFETEPDLIYASLIFEKTRPLAERLLELHPKAIMGGTGWDLAVTLEQYGIETKGQDYSIYPRWKQSIGFTQRGCRLKCSFCVVPAKEGAVRQEQTIAEVWRGEGHPRELILLDNDFFGQPEWRERIDELREGNFRVSFNQGINARFLNDESAAAIASVDYRNDGMKTKRIYTAWDNKKDEGRLFRGLELLCKYGVKPAHIMVYILVGYWPGETQEDREIRRVKLREFGAVPYPMPYVRTRELVGFQRWIIGAYDKKISWEDWVRARYRPERLNLRPTPQMKFPD